MTKAVVENVIEIEAALIIPLILWLFLVIAIIIYFCIPGRKRAIAVITDSNDKNVYAIYQVRRKFVVQNLVIEKIPVVKFKTWNDCLTFIDLEKNNYKILK